MRLRSYSAGSEFWASWLQIFIWVVVKIMLPFWVLILGRHLVFRVPKTGPEF